MDIVNRTNNLRPFSWTIINKDPSTPIFEGDIDCRDCGRNIIIHCRKDKDNSYLVTIEAEDFESAYRELCGQISDGIFENNYVTEYPNLY